MREGPSLVDEAARVVALDRSRRDVAGEGLPRLLRHALQALTGSIVVAVSTEVALHAPSLAADAERWRDGPPANAWQPLAEALDRHAMVNDGPTLHALADAVRLASMTVADACDQPRYALRIAFALEAGKCAAGRAGVEPEVLADVERLGVGWLALAAGAEPRGMRPAHRRAHEIGEDLTAAIGFTAASPAPEEVNEVERAGLDDACQGEPDPTDVPDGHVMVCAQVAGAVGPTAEAVRAHAHVIGKPLPLAATPDVAAVRVVLAQEYPYALPAIDRVLSPLAGTRFVRLPPTILVGPPGSGKSRFARRLAELLGTGLWRTDAGRSDNACIAGTDRRWSTAECCHPFLAVARSRLANPLLLVDELDKAGLGRNHGRLWDALLGFLEPETSQAYPDPCLQVDLDLSHVSFVMTCNDVAGLPAPLLDRCRVIDVPSPSARHLDLLLPSVLRAVALKDGLDERWLEPLATAERAAVAKAWRDGSMRQLARLVEGLLRARGRHRPLH